MPRALLADDEPALLAHLERQLAACWPELTIVARAANGREALELAAREHPEVAFLDIRMPGVSGLEVARELTPTTRVVFVTAYDEYAVEAFEAAAADYVQKPVSEKRLQQTVERLRSTPPLDHSVLASLIDQLHARAEPKLTWLRVGDQDATRLVSVDEVLYFQAEHKYTNVITSAGTHLVRTAIKHLEEQLDAQRFWRVHRSYIVNVAAIEEARRDLRGRYVLKIRGRRETVRTSPNYGHLFRQM